MAWPRNRCPFPGANSEVGILSDIMLAGVGAGINALEPGSPIWWLHRLLGQLLIDRPRMVLMDRYYRGEHPLPDIPRELTREYRRMLVQSRSNFMGVVVDAPAERLSLQGFRVRGAEDADQDAWAWWLDQGMDVDANIAIVNALSMGRGYLSVWKYQGEDEPRVQIEDPRMAMVEMDHSNRQRRAAGLRLSNDDWTGTVCADVWFNGERFRFRSKADRMLRSTLWPQTWQPPFPIDDSQVRFTNQVLREEPAKTVDEWSASWIEVEKAKNPYGDVPIIPIVNKPSTLKIPDGESEIDDVYLTQERINEMLFNRSLAAWTAAYQQKWATGIDIPIDPKTGQAIQTFQAAIDRLFADTSPEAKFGAFPATDLNNYIQAVEEDVQHIAVQTRTPRHYFLQQGQSPSGDAIKSAEAGLVAKVLERQKQYGRSFSEAIRLWHKMKGQTPQPIETIWGDPEFRTLAELTDAIIKQVQAGITPIPVAREKLGNSPSEIERMELFDTQTALVADTQAALAAPPIPGQAPAAKPAPVPAGA